MGDDRDGTLQIQFARAPLAGKVKTRMIPHLTPLQACELHCDLVLWTARELVNSRLGTVELSVAGDPAHPLFERCLQLGVDTLTRQSSQDLGQNMHRAILAGLAAYSKVVLVGSDCPAIDKAYLGKAVRALEVAPLVFGPARDGGYVLIGARQICWEVFASIDWGTATVYAETLARLRELNWGWEELPPLADIDRPADQAIWQALSVKRPLTATR